MHIWQKLGHRDSAVIPSLESGKTPLFSINDSPGAPNFRKFIFGRIERNQRVNDVKSLEIDFLEFGVSLIV